MGKRDRYAMTEMPKGAKEGILKGMYKFRSASKPKAALRAQLFGSGAILPEVIKAQAGAATNGVFVAVADRCQDERGVSWISGSLIVGPDGYPLAGPVLQDRTAVLTAVCDLAQARDKSLDGDNGLLADRRPSLYTEP